MYYKTVAYALYKVAAFASLVNLILKIVDLYTSTYQNLSGFLIG